MLSYEQKIELYNDGKYRFKAPPVCTARWDTGAWIKWIDACKGWIVNPEVDEINLEDLQAAADYYDKLCK